MKREIMGLLIIRDEFLQNVKESGAFLFLRNFGFRDLYLGFSLFSLNLGLYGSFFHG